MNTSHTLIEVYDSKDLPFYKNVVGLNGTKYYVYYNNDIMSIQSCILQRQYAKSSHKYTVCTLCGVIVTDYETKNIWNKIYNICNNQLCKKTYKSAKLDMIASKFITHLSHKIILAIFSGVIQILQANGFTKLEIFVIMEYFSL
jgi:hypothetical protein